jgi:hypothetical protein
MYQVTRYELKVLEVDPLMVPTPNLAYERAEASKRRLEQEIDRKVLKLIERQQERDKRRAELLKQFEDELLKPLPYDWHDEPIRMYSARCWY